MLKGISKLLVLLLIIAYPVQQLRAQDGMEELVEDTKSDFLTVVGAGLGGAILGLSTLSFVDEPKNHTKNIVMGASLGIIAGVVVVAMKQADKSQEMFIQEGGASLEPAKDLETYARLAWHDESFSGNFEQSPLTHVNYSFSF